MNKLFTRIATLSVGLTLAIGMGVAAIKGVRDSKVSHATEGDELLTFSSAAVVGGTATGYTSYSDSDWELNIGGNKVSAGWNKTAANARQVGSTFAIDSTGVTATTYGWVASTKSAVAKVGKLEFSYTGGSGNSDGLLWLGYSTDGGTTYSKVTLTSGTQGSSCGSTNTTYTFEFSTIESAMYAIIVTGGASGSAFRFDSVTATLYEGAGSDPGLGNLYIGQIQSGQDPTYGNAFTVGYTTTADAYRFGAYAGDEVEYRSLISAISWTSSDPTVAEISYVADGIARITCHKPGVTVLTASHNASTKLYNDVTATLTVSAGWLESIEISGSMSKTTYYTTDSAWDPSGLVVTGSFHYGWDEVVTDQVSWTYSPAAPASGVSSVTATAYLEIGGYDAEDSTTVSVTVKVPEWTDAEMTGIDNATDVTVNEDAGVKCGSGSKAGSMSISVPNEDAIKLQAYVGGWKGDTVTINVTATTGVTVTPTSLTPTSDNSFTGSGTSFTIASPETYLVEFELENATDETVITLTAANASNCRFVVWGARYQIDAGKHLLIETNTHNTGPFDYRVDSESWVYLMASDLETGDSFTSGLTWTVSAEGIIDYSVDGYTWLVFKPLAVGSVEVTCNHEGYPDATATITINPGTLTSVTVTGSMSKTSYYVGESWSPAGLTATAGYDSGYSKDVTSEVAWTYSPASPALNVNSVVATATYEEVSGNSSAQVVAVTRTNPIQVLYTQTSGASVDVYGYYVGFLDGTGPVIMDGEYGIVIYNKTADVSGYTEKETILHVTGSISIYKGLYEIGSATISVASGTYDHPDAPVVYSTSGGETADKASRLTTVTGTPELVSGSFDDAAGTADIKMNFAVGLNSIQVFYKKAAQTADADAFAAIKAAVAGSDEITIKGFTGWYDGFQVQMNGYVPPAEGYTAEDFAQDLLDQTDAICEDYDGVTNNKTALEAVWSDLASNDKYPSLPSAEKTKLAEAARDESGTVVEQAMARYDYLTGKYSLNNFINGRTPVVFSNSNILFKTSNNTMLIIVVASIATVSSIGLCILMIKKRKHQ